MMRLIKNKILSAFKWLIPSESIQSSKQKWNILSRENARYYIFSDLGKGITEEVFRKSGENDYKRLVANDQTLSEKFGIKDSRVLEIGSGLGRMTEFFTNNFSHVTGVDISGVMIKRARERLAEKKNVELIETDGVRYPFGEASFDVVFSFIVFQHMPDKETIFKNLEEVSRVLKKDGVAKIQFRGVSVPRGNWYYGPKISPEEVDTMAKKVGLQIIKEEGSGGRYYWVWFRK